MKRRNFQFRPKSTANHIEQITTMGMAPINKSASRGIHNLDTVSPILLRRQMRKGISCKGWIRYEINAVLKYAYPELSETSRNILTDEAMRKGKLQSLAAS